ncbi:MAG: hypothetical protein EDX89_05440 [Acidobacteria bacterium]|nr:MAG: hypothetical protein EDX89_05440 [Acidobacteriota bacterium]MCE7956458.1 hypothetical protein [Acidobacteria bacterium ACB2]
MRSCVRSFPVVLPGPPARYRYMAPPRRRWGPARSLALAVGLLAFAVWVVATVGVEAPSPEPVVPERHHRDQPRHEEKTGATDPAPADDPELSAFKAYIAEFNRRAYAGTFPVDRLKVGWQWYPGNEPAYAYATVTDGDPAIYLVPNQYVWDRAWNRQVAAHEMSHLAVGLERDHDAVFQRELRRVLSGRVVKTFGQVRAGSGW